MILPFLWCGC